MQSLFQEVPIVSGPAREACGLFAYSAGAALSSGRHNAYLITIFFSLLQKFRNGLCPSAGNEKLIKLGFCATLAL